MILQETVRQPFFWPRLLKLFIVNMLLFAGISYLMRDRSESFFTMATYSKVTGFALFMATFYTMLQPAQNEDGSVTAPGFSPYGKFFLGITTFILVLDLVLFGIGYLLFKSAGHEVNAGRELVKTIGSAVVFGLMFTGFAYFMERRARKNK